MKFTLFGFNQRVLNEKKLDVAHAAILRWFVDFKDAKRKMMTAQYGGETFYWIKYQALIDDMPCLRIKSKDGVYRRLQQMVDKKILDHYTQKMGGTYSMYKLGEEYEDLLVDEKTYQQALGSNSEPSEKKVGVSDQKSEGTDQKSEGTDQKSEGTDQILEPYGSNSRTKDQSINNSSTKTSQLNKKEPSSNNLIKKEFDVIEELGITKTFYSKLRAVQSKIIKTIPNYNNELKGKIFQRNSNKIFKIDSKEWGNLKEITEMTLDLKDDLKGSQTVMSIIKESCEMVAEKFEEGDYSDFSFGLFLYHFKSYCSGKIKKRVNKSKKKKTVTKIKSNSPHSNDDQERIAIVEKEIPGIYSEAISKYRSKPDSFLNYCVNNYKDLFEYNVKYFLDKENNPSKFISFALENYKKIIKLKKDDRTKFFKWKKKEEANEKNGTSKFITFYGIDCAQRNNVIILKKDHIVFKTKNYKKVVGEDLPKELVVKSKFIKYQ